MYISTGCCTSIASDSRCKLRTLSRAEISTQLLLFAIHFFKCFIRFTNKEMCKINIAFDVVIIVVVWWKEFKSATRYMRMIIGFYSYIHAVAVVWELMNAVNRRNVISHAGLVNVQHGSKKCLIVWMMDEIERNCYWIVNRNCFMRNDILEIYVNMVEKY